LICCDMEKNKKFFRERQEEGHHFVKKKKKKKKYRSQKQISWGPIQGRGRPWISGKEKRGGGRKEREKLFVCDRRKGTAHERDSAKGKKPCLSLTRREKKGKKQCFWGEKATACNPNHRRGGGAAVFQKGRKRKRQAPAKGGEGSLLMLSESRKKKGPARALHQWERKKRIFVVWGEKKEGNA